jgi:alpha-D-ribose 1-methylphosphonate 5-triphosphate synthase subunit PhnH
MSIASSAVFERRPEADEVAFRLQRGFRALLGAMARPGELLDMGELAPDAASEAERMGLTPQAVTILDVLLDAQTSLTVAGDADGSIARALSLRTHAHIRPDDEAAFCIVPRGVTGDAAAGLIARLSPGTLISPHLGATVVAECGTLVGLDADGSRTGSVSGATRPSAFELSGPGVDGTSRIECDRADVIEAIQARGDEFPCGIDLILVDGAGHVACIPRSSQVTSLGEAKGGASWDM